MFVAKKDRTWASSLFVSLSAMGMAAGPLLSLPLSHIGSTCLFGAFSCFFLKPAFWEDVYVHVVLRASSLCQPACCSQVARWCSMHSAFGVARHLGCS